MSTAVSAPPSVVPTKYGHRLEDGRIQRDLCPRFCRLREGQQGLCFVRARRGVRGAARRRRYLPVRLRDYT